MNGKCEAFAGWLTADALLSRSMIRDAADDLR